MVMLPLDHLAELALELLNNARLNAVNLHFFIGVVIVVPYPSSKGLLVMIVDRKASRWRIGRCCLLGLDPQYKLK